ncbi:MAG: radical SAM protein [Clostridia bacterium]|nr:radical SAM protein [Clostridia bacterium]
MSISNKIAQYRAYQKGVCHCTFNPEGPGVVRIHLIPPRFRLFGNPSYIAVLNGYYLLPLGYSWAILLSSLMEEVNRYDGCPITEKDEADILEHTLARCRKAYPLIGREKLGEDLEWMMDMLFAVARGEDPEVTPERLSVREYAPYMQAPHRMDLMVSAMTDGEGNWKCNQKCRFCYAAGQHFGAMRELETQDWKKIIDKLRRAGVPMLTFTGGEPTQRTDLAELISYSKWFVTRLNTNGVLLTPELVASLKEASLDSLQVTLYSSDATVHNALVGSEGHARTVQGIRNALAAGLDVSVNTPLCRQNRDYSATLNFLHSLGVRFVTLSGLICTGGATEGHPENDLTSDELWDIVRQAKAFCDANGMEIDFTSPGLISKERLESLSMNVPACGAALSNMAVAPDGTAVPCQSWLGSDAGLGNLLTQEFADIWKHPKCQALRGMGDVEALSCPFRKEKGE